MMTTGKGRLVALAAVAVGATVALAGCASGDPLDGGSTGDGESAETIVVGSQDYYSNEIIAEIYAQALEENGYTVDRQFRIGQREVYIPEIEDGAIDVFPEYTGNLLQYYVPDTDGHDERRRVRRARDLAARGAPGARPVAGHRPGLVQRDEGVLRGERRHEPRRPQGRHDADHARRQLRARDASLRARRG